MEEKELQCCKKGSSSDKKINGLNKFLEAIADKNRLRIVCLLGIGEKCVCEIYKHLKLSQNLTSYHLKYLENEKIVSWEKRGVKVFYRLRNEELKNNIKLLNKFLKIYE